MAAVSSQVERTARRTRLRGLRTRDLITTGCCCILCVCYFNGPLCAWLLGAAPFCCCFRRFCAVGGVLKRNPGHGFTGEKQAGNSDHRLLEKWNPGTSEIDTVGTGRMAGAPRWVRSPNDAGGRPRAVFTGCAFFSFHPCGALFVRPAS
jgi:hypothetical protein